jgi:chitodextrinase
MKPFRLDRRRCPAAVLAGRLAMLAMLATLAMLVVLAGRGPAASSVTAPAGTRQPGVSVVLTAVREPQARILNPGPPTGLAAIAGDGQVTLSWNPPASDGGAAIIGYDVYMGTSPGGESASPVSASLVAGTSYTVSGLKNGTRYYFTADAVNGANLHSGPSAEASATPAAPVTVPGAPSGLTAAAGDTRVGLSWRAPGSDGGAAITGYRVYLGTGTKPVASVAGTSATVTGLTNGTRYSFKVSAVNAAGEGPASGAVSAAPTAATSQPSPPNGLTAGPGNGQVMLSWTAPGPGGAAISGYEIYRGTSPGGESGTPVNASLVAGTSYTVTGLTNGTTYYFTVAAVSTAKHQGATSGEASATPVAAGASASASGSPSAGTTPTAAGAPGAPTGLAATPGTAVLASATQKLPKPVIISLAAAAIAAALALTARWLRRRARKRRPAAPPSDVRAVPEMGPPHPVNLHDIAPHESASDETVLPETYVVRLEPLPAAIITTLEEIGS